MNKQNHVSWSNLPLFCLGYYYGSSNENNKYILLRFGKNHTKETPI